MTAPKVKPFLKWAGGKRWLSSSGVLPETGQYQRYIEPFLGSGAVYFHLRPRTAVLADVNGELIHLYRTIRDNWAPFGVAMEQHQRQHCRVSDCVKAAVKRGAAVIVTNANHECVVDLYKDAFAYRELTRASVLAASSARRGLTTEAIFFANT